MSLVTKVKHELREVGLVTLYFFFCFGIILLLKKLFLAAYEIEYYAISVVIVGALVAGKIVVVLDHTPLGTRFAARLRPGVAALLKTLIYLGATLLLLAGEKVFHAYRETGALGRSRTCGTIGTATSFSPRRSASAWPSWGITSSGPRTAGWATARCGARCGRSREECAPC